MVTKLVIKMKIDDMNGLRNSVNKSKYDTAFQNGTVSKR